MKKKNSIGKNYIYNLLYEIFLLIVPVLVTPYVSRVLGEEASGQYSYSFSIITYFTLFAALGFGRYAQRLIAQHQGDIKQQSIDFWEIFIARLIPITLTLAVYLLLLALNIYDQKYVALMMIFTINIIAIAFDVTFYFQGNEEFGKIVIRNVLVKFIGFICIFVFVKDSSDLVIYAAIQSLIIFFSNVLLWLYMPKYLIKVSKSEIRPLKHLPATIILFLPTIATSIYTSLDKTLIGVITRNDAENGNYEYAERIVKMALTVVTSLGTVMIPRNSQQFANGNIKGVENNIYKSSRFVMLVGMPMVLGLIAVSDNFVPWYLGAGYLKAANLIKLMSPIIVIIGFSNVFGLQFLIPSGQDKKFSIAVITGAAINFCLNIVMIKWLASYGAAIATVIAEVVVTVVMLIFIRKNISARRIIIDSWKYCIAGLVMFTVCYCIGRGLTPSIVHTCEIVVTGALIYILVIMLLRDDMVLDFIQIIKRRIKKK